jgi:tetratricopeptide (TPR) repeat protein
MEYFDLGKLKEYRNSLPGPQKMVEKEISFKLFDYEIRELIDLVKDKKSNLILITTPLNLEVPPRETCSHSTNNNILELQKDLEEIIKKGNFKTAYPKALLLSRETYSNARSFYLLGKASLGFGDLAAARAAFQKATVFDCSNWRGNAVYNAIIKTQAKKRQVAVIDFDQMMASSLSRDGLFLDDLFPQNIFYQNMIAELLENFKKILSVND